MLLVLWILLYVYLLFIATSTTCNVRYDLHLSEHGGVKSSQTWVSFPGLSLAFLKIFSGIRVLNS